MRPRLKTWLGLGSFAAALLLSPIQPRAEPRAVLELFLSQSCSACRPANQLMAELARDPSLVTVSLPVNYWDYLGWKDTLADPRFTTRQKGYATTRNNQKVFTPEMVVNGVRSSLGSAREKVMTAIEQATRGQAALPIPVDVKEEDGMIVVDIGAGAEEAQAWLVPVRRQALVAIHRGENAGWTEHYTNVARGMRLLGTWSGSSARFRVPLDAARVKGADSYLVLLQEERDGKPGQILGVAKGLGL